MLNPDPILLSHEEHVTLIMRRFRLKQSDEIAKDIIYNDQLCRVSKAMAETEPMEKAVAAIWSSYFGFLMFGTLLIWELIR